jgi:hypothetical protein
MDLAGKGHHQQGQWGNHSTSRQIYNLTYTENKKFMYSKTIVIYWELIDLLLKIKNILSFPKLIKAFTCGEHLTTHYFTQELHQNRIANVRQ